MSIKKIQRKTLKTVRISLAVLLLGPVAFVLEWHLQGAAPWFSAGFLLLAGIVLVLVAHVQQSRAQCEILREVQSGFSNQEAYTALTSLIQPRFPLPQTRGFAASPDFIKLIIEEVLEQRPRFIAELGGGTSTVYLAYMLEKLQQGKILSIDQSAEYAAHTEAMLARHGLSAYAQVHHAPLAAREKAGETFTWYDDFTEKLEKIDLLVVDGPSASHKTNPRYPALPVLYEHLAPQAAIIIDDYHRPTAKNMVKAWMRAFPDLKLSEYPTEKETAVLRRG